MTNEVELKLELTPEAAEALLASGLLPGAPRRLDLTSTYFDTSTLRLSRRGSRSVSGRRTVNACRRPLSSPSVSKLQFGFITYGI
jgi:hypothetical protein